MKVVSDKFEGKVQFELMLDSDLFHVDAAFLLESLGESSQHAIEVPLGEEVGGVPGDWPFLEDVVESGLDGFGSDVQQLRQDGWVLKGVLMVILPLSLTRVDIS